jgi:hypothetical protein
MQRMILLATFLAGTALPATAQAPMVGEIGACEPTGTRYEWRCLIELTENGEPVADATFMVRADMPEMPMAHNVPPATAEPADEPGTYAVVLPLEMDGLWLLRLDLTEPRRDVVIIRHAFGEEAAHGHGHGHEHNHGEDHQVHD